jgi:VanZ family protein
LFLIAEITMGIVKRHWKSIVWALLIFFFSVMPIRGVPHYKLFQIPYFDKWIHLMFYLVLGALLFYEINATTGGSKINFKTILYIGIITIGYGVLIEFIQFSILPSRSGEPLDVLANTTGFLLSAILYKLHLKLNKKRI